MRARRVPKPKRCSYCSHAARTVLTWFRRLQGRVVLGGVAACPDHEDCENFVSMRDLNPDARVRFIVSARARLRGKEGM